MVNKRWQPTLIGAFMLGVTGLAFASGSAETTRDGAITVSSKIDTEGALLGYMIIERLEDAGLATIDAIQLGPTDVVKRALENGEIDIYPEYTGNGAFFFDAADEAVWNDAAAGYARVSELDLSTNNVVWLEPAPANNTWAIAVRQELVAAGVRTLADIGPYLAGGGQFRLAASEEFVTRPDVLPAFERTYNFDLENDNLLVFSGGNTATTIQAAARGQEGVNAAMAYGTDGQLAALGLTVLIDDAGVQPVYLPAPRVRAAVLDRHPEIAELLDPVFALLDLTTLQQLNAAISVEGRAPRQVAREYLQRNGLLTAE